MSHWLIQDTSIPYWTLDETSETLKKLDMKMSGFGVIPFTNDLTGLDNLDSENYVVRGSTKLLKMFFAPETKIDFKDYPEIYQKIAASIYYDIDAFDQINYMDCGLPVVNGNCKVYAFSDVIDVVMSQDTFVKPSRDIKYFAGLVVPAGLSLRQAVFNQGKMYDYDIPASATMMVGPIRSDIYAEYRLFVVNDNIVYAVRSHLNGRVNISESVSDDITSMARSFIKHYSPHDIFTIDVAVTNNGIEIVEFNCWNVSGFYGGELEQLFIEVDAYANKT